MLAFRLALAESSILASITCGTILIFASHYAIWTVFGWWGFKCSRCYLRIPIQVVYDETNIVKPNQRMRSHHPRNSMPLDYVKFISWHNAIEMPCRQLWVYKPIQEHSLVFIIPMVDASACIHTFRPGDQLNRMSGLFRYCSPPAASCLKNRPQYILVTVVLLCTPYSVIIPQSGKNRLPVFG